MSEQANELGNIDYRQATRGESLVDGVSTIAPSQPVAIASSRNSTSADFTLLQVTSFSCALFAASCLTLFLRSGAAFWLALILPQPEHRQRQ